ncbi:unnamed protein product [Miscanthus lutarioriparius]|uniref:leucine--tRNA ligase n=1 Tax=Miscanthus lutarioriparius TaxID=422564 RepID=A0A811PJX7_9POAL|nr:unnamed protein product [Miscanthus lutarioriparius]
MPCARSLMAAGLPLRAGSRGLYMRGTRHGYSRRAARVASTPSEAKFLNRGIKEVVRSICCGNMGKMSSNPDEPKSRARTDFLLNNEAEVQMFWDENKVFEADPGNKPPSPGEKFFGNFPYPYMNGLLHLGHAFSLSKLEFGAAYHRLHGSNVLLPFAFHRTGMPIKASADKLAREIQQYGYPPVFPAAEDCSAAVDAIEADQADVVAPNKFKGKKSKATAKAGAYKYQWEIMKSFGLDDEEIARFQDPYHWLTYFPPLAKEVLKKFGLGCDRRRSFITTDMNPYYDAFVKWQMRKLKKLGKVVKDMRYTIYSPLDGQPCADHDRATGEGVQPQEYILIKMEVISPFPPKLKALEGRKVYLAAATLRPETMYGETNCWVLPDGMYGAFEINDTDVFILTARSALNLAYQHLSRVPEKPTCLCELSGNDLIGLPLKSPLAFNETIYALPMLTVLTDKDKSAEKVCHDLKIKSQNDKEKLAEAKRMTYLKGFTDGTMVVGEFSGKKVQEAKPLIKSKLLEEGTAVLYSEPEMKVMSRSGDECVVALTDQWYITYGEAEWRQKAVRCLDCMNTFSTETRNVAHLLQNGNMYGKEISSVRPEEMTDEVWDFVFCDGPALKSDLPAALLDKMKQEFEYWYPFDIRVSGKDLIQNHLTFCIYNHTALLPEHHWPLGFRCNGHLMLNSEKMSESTGNFLTLEDAIKKYSSDATRFALADAGDGMDDANFVTEIANSAVMKLTKEISWMEEVTAAESKLRAGPPTTFADRVFANEMNIAIKEAEKNYNAFMFKDALKFGFRVLQLARDEYRLSCGAAGMNRDLLWRFMDVQTRLITPICPHYAEHVWQKIMKKEGIVIKAGWPDADTPDPTLRIANKYLQDSIVSMRKLLQEQESGSKKPKKGAAPAPPSKEKKMSIGLIYVNEHYCGWEEQCLRVLQSKFDSQSRSFAPDQEIAEALKGCTIGQEMNLKQVQQLCMPFIKKKKDEAREVGPQALDLKLPFSEMDVLRENLEPIKRQLGLEQVEVLPASDEAARAKAGEHASLLEKKTTITR